MDTGLLLTRLSGVAAIIGGALRIASIFIPLTTSFLPLFWFTTDVFLLIGLMGFYLTRARELGVVGLLGFGVAIIGLLTIRSAEIFGPLGYTLGATIFLAGPRRDQRHDDSE